MRTRYWTQIQLSAATYNLDPILVEAIVVQESAGNTDAFRFEPNFYNRYLKISPDWEWARTKYNNPRRISSSYGLMQVMWPTAIETGFSKTLEPEQMFMPQVGLDYGCRRLRALEDWAAGYPTVSPADRRLATLASYNGGKGGNTPGTVLRNGAYARSVMSKYAILQQEHSV